jgi:hypothetical protein
VANSRTERPSRIIQAPTRKIVEPARIKDWTDRQLPRLIKFRIETELPIVPDAKMLKMLPHRMKLAIDTLLPKSDESTRDS